MTIVVRTPARLHLGILDTNGGLGRLYGSIGVAIERPNVTLEAEVADRLLVEGLEADRVVAFARCFLDRYPLPSGARLRLRESIPPHVGLGSGTQLALAVGTALVRLSGLKLSVAELAVAAGRGVHSGIGIAAFQRGGFVMDAGHRVIGNVGRGVPDGAHPLAVVSKEIPQVLFHHPFPEDWYFVVAIPKVEAGLSGERELKAFQMLPPAPAALVEKISRLLLMKMLPALVERDVACFGQALTEIQQVVGDSFAAVQGRRYANILLERLIDYLLDRGAVGAGQSSWGPTVYALVRGRDRALLLEREAQQYLAGHGGGQTLCARADNRGARVRQAGVRSQNGRLSRNSDEKPISAS